MIIIQILIWSAKHNEFSLILLQALNPLPTYNKFTADDFENIRNFLNESTIFELSWKRGDKRRNWLFWAISSFVDMFSKSCLLQRHQKLSLWGERFKPFQAPVAQSVANLAVNPGVVSLNPSSANNLPNVWQKSLWQGSFVYHQWPNSLTVKRLERMLYVVLVWECQETHD